MVILGCDPGFNFTGVAAVYPGTENISAEEFAHPMDALRWLREFTEWRANTVLILEDYLGSGHLTKEAKETIRVLGLIHYSMEPYVKVVLRGSQRRLSEVSRAASYGYGKDATAALAHVFAYIRENK